MKTKIFYSILAALFLFFTVSASKTNFFTANATADVKSTPPATLAVLTKNLEYDFDKPSIRDDYYSNLDRLAATVMKENYAVSLRGHADSIGKYKYNWVLSDRRAISVKSYLVSKGVKESRVVTTPFGSTVPVATNKTPEGRQKNRRVEIELKKIK